MKDLKDLYPIRFKPILSKRVWGGDTLIKDYNKGEEGKSYDEPIGESWDVCGFEDNSSIIKNGFLAKNDLFSVVEIYMGNLVGDDIYKKYGNEFPLLIKLLNIEDRLSVQVHPDNLTAFDRHNSYGKTEAWYVLEADENAKIYMGFNKDMSPNEFYERSKKGTLEEVLNVIKPKKGDFFFIEAGLIHSAQGHLVIAEVQQLSDVTYRIYDWGRENDPKTRREMHLDLAFDVINYKKYDKDKYFIPSAETSKNPHRSPVLTKNEFFSINELALTDPLHIYIDKYKSFILYFCCEGQASIKPYLPKKGKDQVEILNKGEWILVPASYDEFLLSPETKGTKVLEVFVPFIEDTKDDYIDESIPKEIKD